MAELLFTFATKLISIFTEKYLTLSLVENIDDRQITVGPTYDRPMLSRPSNLLPSIKPDGIIVRMKKLILMGLVSTLSLPVQAQVVMQAASAQLQPQIGRDANGYTTCGMRAVVLDMKPDVVEAYDFSLNLRLGMTAGAIKAGKLQTPGAKFKKGQFEQKVVLPGPTNFWIAKESEGKALIPTKIFAADSPGYILGLADFIGTLSAVTALLEGERMQFATRYKNQPYDTVVSFSGALSAEEAKPLMACLEGLINRMQEEAGK
ncbi:hypothetical protein [Massilia litorea]|uniref:Uncharacterized protein n=1 Tax=Massilia litorea TaxID=2769491 RepID=A0A7L9TZN3_9BURK|nr:hypothetical protein [Massilia litorea]QOL48140.1 hypothetical protein LPB04_14165 [Massilia litorea]